MTSSSIVGWGAVGPELGRCVGVLGSCFERSVTGLELLRTALNATQQNNPKHAFCALNILMCAVVGEESNQDLAPQCGCVAGHGTNPSVVSAAMTAFRDPTRSLMARTER